MISMCQAFQIRTKNSSVDCTVWGLCVVFVVVFLFVLFYFETGFLRVILHSGCTGTSSVDRTGLEIMEIRLPLPPKCWD